MRNTSIYSAVILLIALILSGCNQTKVTVLLPKPPIATSKPANNVICPKNAAGCLVNSVGEDKVFFEAISKDNTTVVSAMIRKDRQFLSIRNTLDASPLHIAVKTGNIKCLLTLIKAGADINAANKQGRTPLHVAATTGNLSALKILIEHGASVSAISRSMNTPLHDAAAKGNIEVVKYLVAKGANINSVNNRGATPLKTATKNKHNDIARYLISKGANKSVFCCADL